ncbi:MAG: DUF433 domain-containing protein [Opitutales bacterium]
MKPQFDRITRDPAQMNGQACVRGMRLTVKRVLEAMSAYPDREELLEEYPELEPEDLDQVQVAAASCH